LSADEVCSKEPFISPDVREALYFPCDWQVENRKLLVALMRYAELNSIEIRENTRIERLIVDDGRVTGAESNAGVFTADKTILATGAWTSLIKLGLIEFPVKVEPVRGQINCWRPEARLLKHVIYSRQGYVVPRGDGRILAGSTSENVGFEKAVTDDAMDGLQKMATEILPFLGGLEVADRWSGLRPFAADGMPIVGEISDINRLFIATAHYRNGILLAPLTAKLAAEKLVYEKDSEYFRIFGPDRFWHRSVTSCN
jgi:glycine oxidase